MSSSCQRCYQSKVKCDKSAPRCGACEKADVECLPAVNTRTNPALRKRTKRRGQDEADHERIARRLQRCEDYLRKLGLDPESIASGSNDDGPSQYLLATPDSLAHSEDNGGVSADGVNYPSSASISLDGMMDMLHGDFDQVYRPLGPENPDRTAEQFVEISKMYDRKFPQDGIQWVFWPEVDGSNDDADHLEHPDPFHIFPLWSIYQQYVQPLSLILHEPDIVDLIVRTGPILGRKSAELSVGQPQVEARDHAILFAIYHAAVSSQPSEMVQQVFGRSLEELRQHFRQCVRYWLRRANFSRTIDLQVCQALVVYLISLDKEMDPRSMTGLIGLAKANVRRVHHVLSSPRSPGSKPRLDVDLARRLWWELVALKERTIDRGGTLGLALREDEALVCMMPLPEFIPDSDFDSIPTLGHGGRDKSVSSMGASKASKVLPLVRYEVLQLALKLERHRTSQDMPEQHSDARLNQTMQLIDVAQNRLRVRYLDNRDCDGDEILKFARLWLEYRTSEMRLSANLHHERQHCANDPVTNLVDQRRISLQLCMTVLQKYRDIYLSPFVRSAGWQHQITSWVQALLHLFRLARSTCAGRFGVGGTSVVTGRCALSRSLRRRGIEE